MAMARDDAIFRMLDLGLIARTRTVDGKAQRGFEMYVGGGLGTVPHQAKLFDEFSRGYRTCHLRLLVVCCRHSRGSRAP